jgi:Icc-related predicted phosphoesterase
LHGRSPRLVCHKPSAWNTCVVQKIKIAAAGDIHAAETHAEKLREAFGRAAVEADAILLAGDLTSDGEPSEAQVLADACRGVDVPVFAVLGNHDFHLGREDEISEILDRAGVRVLHRDSAVWEIGGIEVGVVGTKGFVGGFVGSALPDFGERLLREVYAETTEEARALGRGLRRVSHCSLRIVLLHYAPIADTLVGEPAGIHAFLGSSRLANPIQEYRPDIVLHGHAHAGTFEGRIGDVPVYNVAVHVTGRDFWIFYLEVEQAGHAAVEVEGRTEGRTVA